MMQPAMQYINAIYYQYLQQNDVIIYSLYICSIN